MRRYSETDERHVRSQAETLLAGCRVELRRTDVFLRVALAFFTALVVAAVVFFVLELLNLHDATGVTIVTGVASVACLVVAEALIGTFRLYRFGVEEMLVACSVILLSISVSEFWTSGT